MSGEQLDWYDWHAPYDDPDAPLLRRLRLVQGHIRAWLDERRGRDVRVVSACAGQGRDLLEVLVDTPRAGSVCARLVELDPRNASVAQETARRAGLDGIEIVTGDAGHGDAYRGAVPADLVLLCGVFGNIADDDVRRTVERLPQLCAPGATVIWTRGRRPRDVTPAIRDWFGKAGFDEQAFDAPADTWFSVGVHRLTGAPQELLPGLRLFSFVR